jgi:DNA-binding transcriptional LysR family regulator
MFDEHIEFWVRVVSVSEDEITTQPIATMRQVVCARSGYLTDKGRPLLPEDIVSHSVIKFSRSGNQVPWNFKTQSGEAYDVPVKSGLIMNSAEGSIGSARDVLGLTQLY